MGQTETAEQISAECGMPRRVWKGNGGQGTIKDGENVLLPGVR